MERFVEVFAPSQPYIYLSSEINRYAKQHNLIIISMEYVEHHGMYVIFESRD